MCIHQRAPRGTDSTRAARLAGHQAAAPLHSVPGACCLPRAAACRSAGPAAGEGMWPSLNADRAAAPLLGAPGVEPWRSSAMITGRQGSAAAARAGGVQRLQRAEATGSTRGASCGRTKRCPLTLDAPSHAACPAATSHTSAKTFSRCYQNLRARPVRMRAKSLPVACRRRHFATTFAASLPAAHAAAPCRAGAR